MRNTGRPFEMKMLPRKSVFCLIFLPLLIDAIQINLHRTEDNGLLQHCLSVSAWPVTDKPNPRQILRYCLGESPSRRFDPLVVEDQSRLSFAQLAARKISSRELYLWSAPIDLVEQYQSYLNQPSSSKDMEYVYNCSCPRFGLTCEYSFDFPLREDSFPSLSELIHQFYLTHPYEPSTLTCYVHLPCRRGPSPSCLDWTEICDGQIHCLDGGEDEKHCWQLELNECEENEYRCNNGQCISKIFYRNGDAFVDCVDCSDEGIPQFEHEMNCQSTEPIFACEDIVCSIYRFSDSVSLSSSCVRQRNDLLTKALFSVKPSNLSDLCWFALKCLIHSPLLIDIECYNSCQFDQCQHIIQNECPSGLILIPADPFLFGHLFFAYEKSQFDPEDVPLSYSPRTICYNHQLCHHSLLNFSCHHSEEMSLVFSQGGVEPWADKYVPTAFERFRSCNSLQQLCVSEDFYRCHNSTKCISPHRLLDRVRDCFYADDELVTIVRTFVTLESNDDFFRCPTLDVFIAIRLVDNGICDCPGIQNEICDDEYSLVRYSQTHLSFPVMCDGFIDLLPVMIEGERFDDESECEHWSCKNVYTRCNHFWNCPDGLDEVDCDPPSVEVTYCPPNERRCVQPETNTMQCLPVARINDGQIDCLGASDEVNLCRSHTSMQKNDRFHCQNDSVRRCIDYHHLCDGYPYCSNGDDEKMCPAINGTSPNRAPWDIFMSKNNNSGENLRFLGQRFYDQNKPSIVHFTLEQQAEETTSFHLSSSSIVPLEHSGRCHRGLPVKMKLGVDERQVCFCPPSFYGDHCEYQNERVSLTIQFRALSDSWQTLFSLIVLLIEETDQRRVHSSEQFTYLSMRDCQVKFNLYLLYSTRPKNSSLNYFIRIDLYEKMTLTYRSSWLIPLRYPFLPVQRLSIQLDIPHLNTDKTRLCSDLRCLHGRCLKYSNSLEHFCQCHPGWSGRLCQIPLTTCRCSADSHCLGEDVDHRSICLCSKDKLGSRCFIESNICGEKNNSMCQNGGECLSNDEDVIDRQRYVCICPRGWTGDRCERKQREVIITFDRKILLPSSMLIHFIRTYRDHPHENVTTFTSIPLNGDPVRLFWSTPFELLFLELFPKNYYLAIAERSASDSIEKQVTQTDRCLSVNEIFNETIIQLHPLRRMKFYHLPCRRESSPMISCFFDEVHLCFCQLVDGQRVTNCLEFDHRMKRDCLGQNGCENGAQCFQDDSRCPQSSMCICSECFYGRRCQFSMNGFSLSLDGILGYHIRPNVSLRRQASVIQITLIVTIVMTLIGWINGILAFVTFNNKKTREVGCGYYLLGSSLTTLLTMTMFAVKFFLLLVTQMELVTDRSFLHIQCLLVDFLVRICLNMDQWLNACVAIERAITILEGANFSRSKSRQKAKHTIGTLLVMIVASTVYDPIYRRLIDDLSLGEEKRIWCIASYPRWLRVFDSAINMIHFSVPFGINIISAVIIIWKSARQRTSLGRHLGFRQLLGEQFQHHKHLLIAPFLIVLLGLPRLIISVLSGCVKSTRNSWLYLLGYLISFISPMLTFVLFVLPSKLYKEEFNQSMRNYRRNLRSRFVSFRRFWSIRT